jgi:hypothetical protein
MDIQKAYSHLSERLAIDRGRFYGGVGNGLPLGVGLIYDSIRFPVYEEENRLFATAEGLVYVLTHECDISQDNQRIFNDRVLVCPVLALEDFVAEYSIEYSDNELLSFLSALADKRVFRVVYIPPISPRLQYGGLLNLNEVSHTSVSEFDGVDAKRIQTLTSYGVGVVDNFIKNHLLRAKSVRLAYEY